MSRNLISSQSVSGPVAVDRVVKTMLTPQELSERTGINIDTLANWRTMRRNGIDIGPKFVKPNPEAGTKGRSTVRYLIRHVEEWEDKLAANEEVA
jgi:hypothetical protein